MRLLLRFTRTAIAVLLTLLAVPMTARAQTATILGSLANFDVVNNSGHDAHGFEIEFEGLQPADVPYTFSVQRYGDSTITATPTGVRVRWASAYDAAAQQFVQTTLAHQPGAAFFSGNCYQWNGVVTYDAAGCEHFGALTSRNATATTFRWLIADPQTAGALVAVNPPVAVAAPMYSIAPPLVANTAPVLVAEVEAPEPPETPETYGDAQWMKVFKTELQREVGLDELLSDNAIVPQDPAQLEVAWEIVQAEPASANAKRNRSRNQNQGGLSPATRSVVRRYEMYDYSGAYDPITHEALCADLLCNAPQTGELGDFISAQMTAVNVQADSVSVAKVGNGNVDSSDKLISCGNKCAASYTAGTAVTLTAKAASGSTFSTWTGACGGAAPTCTVTATGNVGVGATFVVAPPSGGGGGGGAAGGGGGGGAAGGGGGGGAAAASFTVSIARSNKGTVTSDAAGISCGNICTAKFAQGTSVTLTATPPVGLLFLGWGGACSGTAPTCTMSITSNMSVQANFSK
jgi:Divergent InlB B-repeat domain